MKGKIVFFVLLSVLITQIIVAQPVKDSGHLRVDGTQLKDQNNNAITLRGMSFGWHNFWPGFYNPETVKWLYNDWGCSVVRAAMGVEPERGYIQNPAWSKAKIKSVVDGAIKEGIYVIIDWHSHNINLSDAKKFFTEMAKTYGHHPNIIYEIFNEPDHETWNEVKSYSTELISTIRAIDKDNIILVGTPHWDQDIHLAADDPITGYENIMYSVHFYAATHKQSLRDRCDYALNKGLPLFISESAGMEATGDGAIDDQEWKNWIEWAEKRQISWITWSVSDKDETCSVLKPGASHKGGWQLEDLKESGLKSRAFLRHYSLKDK